MKTIKEYLNEGLIRRQAGMDMRAKIEAWLKICNIRNYTINDDLTIDVNGDVDIRLYGEKALPEYIQFGKIKRDFRIFHCPILISLRGFPKEVGGSFWCVFCGKQFTIDDVRKVCKVKGRINV